MRIPLLAFLLTLMLSSALRAGEAYVHEGTVEKIAEAKGVRFDGDGTLLIAAGRRGVIRVDLTSPGAMSTTSVSDQPCELLSSGPIALASDGIALRSLDKSAPIPQSVPANATSIASNDKEIAWCLRDQDAVFRMPLGNGEPTPVVIKQGGWLAPEALAFAPDGSLWVADTGHSRVVCLAADGSSFATGERGFFPGQFIEPYSIAFDAGGPLVSDRLGHRITRLDWKGALRDVFGLHALRPREGKGKIHYPTAIAIDAKTGRVAVCEGFERRVQVFRPLRAGEQPPVRPPMPSREGVSSHFGVDVSSCSSLVAAWEPESGTVVLWDTRSDPPIYVSTLGGNGDKPGRFIRPVSVQTDADGMGVWVLDALVDRVEHWRLKRDLSRELAFDAFMAVLDESIDLVQVRKECSLSKSRPVDLIFKAGSPQTSQTRGAGVVFASGDIAWVTTNGETSLCDARPRAADLRGKVIASAFDADANEILLLWPGAIERRSPKGASVMTLPESIRSPQGIAAGLDGHVYVSDSADDALIELDPQGKVIRTFGLPPRAPEKFFDGIEAAKNGSLWLPAGVDTGDGKSVYVVDYGNHRLQRFGRDGSWQASFTLSKSRAANPSPQPGMPDAAVEAKAQADRASWIALLKAGHGSFNLQSGGTMTWKAVEPIARAEPFALEVTAVDADGKPLEGYELRCDAEMPQHNHGMNVVPKVTQVSPGHWRAEPLLFHMPGRWELIFDLKKDGRVRRNQATLELE
ncbi:MAG: FixH family protein [Planctomycetes bacterium]|nr:FixH family protein [Planctomycetota bacterium]